MSESYETWLQYVDPHGLYSRTEYEALTPEGRMKILAECGWESDICPECDGTETVDCPTCDGTGEGYHDGARCDVCRGKGYRTCSVCERDDWDPPDNYEEDN